MSDKCSCEIRIDAGVYGDRYELSIKPYSPACPVHGKEIRAERAAPRMLELLRAAGQWYCGELPDETDRREAIRALLEEIDGDSAAYADAERKWNRRRDAAPLMLELLRRLAAREMRLLLDEQDALLLRDVAAVIVGLDGQDEVTARESASLPPAQAGKPRSR